MRPGFRTRDELALTVALLVLTFSCHVVGVCVCLGLDQCFWGSTECAEDEFWGIIDLFYYRLKKIRETTMSIYSNRGVSFLNPNLYGVF